MEYLSQPCLLGRSLSEPHIDEKAVRDSYIYHGTLVMTSYLLHAVQYNVMFTALRQLCTSRDNIHVHIELCHVLVPVSTKLLRNMASPERILL